MTRGRGLLFLLGVVLIFAGSALASLVQSAGGVRVLDIRFAGASGKALSALLYVPPDASIAHKAPGILAVHGYINSRETQSAFAIEFARRGYVVLAMDQTGHGYSAPPAFADGFGGPDGLRYLRGLDIVDADNIGLEGHSMGGWAVLKAAEALPDGYKSMLLIGSSTGTAGTMEGTAIFPRNLGLIYSHYDEFSRLMWGTERAADVARSPKLVKLFGITAEARIGRLYGDVDAGTARILLAPAITHPMDHLSRETVADSIIWFARTLKGGTPLAAYDQVWFWKELGTAMGLVGLVVLLLGTIDVLLVIPGFAVLDAQPDCAIAARDLRWWTSWGLMVWVPVLSYFAFLGLGIRYFPAGPVFRQAITNQILVWAGLNAVVTVVVGLVTRGQRAEVRLRIVPSLGLALAVAAVGYLAVVLVGHYGTVDLRFWMIAMKPLSRDQFVLFLTYLPGFTAVFLAILHMLHTRLSCYSDSAMRQYIANGAALGLGFAIFLGAQYGSLPVIGHILTPEHPLDVILAIQFLPLLVAVSIISTFAWRRTGTPLPGGLLCGILVTWYIVAGQATQVAL